MKNFNFYFYLNLFNILLVIFMFGMFLIFFITCYISPNWILPSCFILLCILAKIFLLYLLFITFEKFFPNSELIKVAEELKTNSTRRKYSLLLAFGYWLWYNYNVMFCIAWYDRIPFWMDISFVLWDNYTWWGMYVLYNVIWFMENPK